MGPHEISVERLAKNDLNFMLIYDLLEAFHNDNTPEKFFTKNFEDVLKTAPNIYPPYEYQRFINSKMEYYNYMNENGIPIVPTLSLTKERAMKDGIKSTVLRLMAEMRNAGWANDFIAKPVLGQESKDYRRFARNHEERLTKYLEKALKKYPGIIFQKYITGFGASEDCPEVRMYYVGDNYQFSMVATPAKIHRPNDEGGELDLPINTPKRKKVVKQILKKLPTIKMPNGVTLPRMLTRVDLGLIRDGKPNPFVNEIEFVPSLYIEDHPYLIDQALGDQMVKITQQYVKARNKIEPPPKTPTDC